MNMTKNIATLLLTSLASLNAVSQEFDPSELAFSLNIRDGQFLDESSYERGFQSAGLGLSNNKDRGFVYHAKIYATRIDSGDGFEGLNTISFGLDGGYRNYPIPALPIYMGLNVGYEKTFMGEYYDYNYSSEEYYGIIGVYTRSYLGLSLRESKKIDIELGYKIPSASVGSLDNMLELSIIFKN